MCKIDTQRYRNLLDAGNADRISADDIEALLDHVEEKQMVPVPKFKVGDKLRFYNITCIVLGIDVEQRSYYLEYADSSSGKHSFETVHNRASLVPYTEQTQKFEVTPVDSQKFQVGDKLMYHGAYDRYRGRNWIVAEAGEDSYTISCGTEVLSNWKKTLVYDVFNRISTTDAPGADVSVSGSGCGWYEIPANAIPKTVIIEEGETLDTSWCQIYGHKWETKTLFTSEYEACIHCGEERK